MQSTEIQLPSGAVLTVQPAPFADARNLYQAIMRQAKDINLSSDIYVTSIIKDLFCLSFSSKEIESLVWECMKRCTYNKNKFTDDTFEAVENRQDYIKVLAAVATANTEPFFRSLFAEYKTASKIMESIQA